MLDIAPTELLLVAVVALVVGFGTSTSLATAYGIAVTGTLLVDSILFLVVVRLLWRKPLWMVVAGVVGFVSVDLLFLAANAMNEDGWRDHSPSKVRQVFAKGGAKIIAHAKAAQRAFIAPPILAIQRAHGDRRPCERRAPHAGQLRGRARLRHRQGR